MDLHVPLRPNDLFLLGHLGHLTLNIPWANLTSKPAEIVIEDLYVLAIPAAESKVDLEEDEARAQASKQERLKNAEVLQKSGKNLNSDDDKRSQGVFESLMAKIVNNVQVTIKNIHIRYEDKLSVPGVCTNIRLPLILLVSDCGKSSTHLPLV